MSNSYVLLEKIVVPAAGASSVTFSNIPQTGYTDLVVKVSVRNNNSGMRVQFNGDTAANYSWRRLNGNGAAAFSDSNTTYGSPYNTFLYFSMQNSTTDTANTFSNGEMYVPNYTGSTQKSASLDSVAENNATTAYIAMQAGLWTGTAAITSVTLSPDTGTSPSFAANSTFYLYGVAKLGTTPTIAPKATGGDVIDTDGTYWYHIFRSSGTFTPAVALSCDYLVVAGGGGGGGRAGGGAGAGGLRSTVTATGGGGSLETALSLATNTAYTVTVGAGGAGASSETTKGTNGSNSVFSTITSTGGGGGGGANTDNAAGANGGSGGGGAGNNYFGGTHAAGTGTTNQGFAGGTGNSAATGYGAGGGGGAGVVGANGTSSAGGNGGNGVATSISGSSVTYAGGGGGGTLSGTAGTGGTGGGGAGSNSTTGTAGTANTGGGGGGAAGASGSVSGGAGGSGIVIVRYLVA